jgi:molecular chaperone GrpE
MTTSRRRIPINHGEPLDEAPTVADAVEEPNVSANVPANEEVETNAVPISGTTNLNDPGTRVTDPTTQLAEATRERDALADSLLRLRAEFENFRKRAARELVDARDRARGELLADLLPVLDNLERALDAAEHHDEGKVLGGVRLTRDLFLDLLRRSGVEEIETVGTDFDPRVHDAVIAQSSDEDEGKVTAVLERGYRQGDRVLRPAKVVVSSGQREPGRSDSGA